MTDLPQPLTDTELERLDCFLADRIDEDTDTEGRDAGVLDISDLDGMLTAIVSGPVTVPPSRWLPCMGRLRTGVGGDDGFSGDILLIDLSYEQHRRSVDTAAGRF